MVSDRLSKTFRNGPVSLGTGPLVCYALGMDFNEIAQQHTNEEFDNLTKIVDGMSDAEREAYAERNPQRYWMQIQWTEESGTYVISAN